MGTFLPHARLQVFQVTDAFVLYNGIHLPLLSKLYTQRASCFEGSLVSLKTSLKFDQVKIFNIVEQVQFLTIPFFVCRTHRQYKYVMRSVSGYRTCSFKMSAIALCLLLIFPSQTVLNGAMHGSPLTRSWAGAASVRSWKSVSSSSSVSDILLGFARPLLPIKAPTGLAEAGRESSFDQIALLLRGCITFRNSSSCGSSADKESYKAKGILTARKNVRSINSLAPALASIFLEIFR